MPDALDTLRTDALGPCALRAGQRVVVGVSGGVDSVVLLHALAEIGVAPVAVYVDHGLRAGTAGEGAFVQDVAGRIGAEAVVAAVSVGAGNRQAAARDARYAALADVAARLGIDAVAVGHTATDQAETVLMALVRGAGLRGIAGMSPRRELADGVALVRPLLHLTRADVEALARGRGWTWREDPTNATDAFRRNRVRHAVLPLLDAEGGPATALRIAATADDARAALAGLDGRIVPDGDGVSVMLPDLDMRETRALIVADALARVGAPRSREIVARSAALVDAPVGRRVGLGRVVVWRDRDRLRFVRVTPPAEPVRLRPGETATPAGTLVRALLDAVPDGREPGDAWVDADMLGDGLWLRPWRAGDRLTPVGGGTRSVAEVLAAARVPPSRRAEALVLVTAAKPERVVWVVGHRLAAWAAVTPATRCVEHLAWTPVTA